MWVHKYDLLGLLNYYQATGDEPALEASRKIGDLLARTFGTGPGQRDIIPPARTWAWRPPACWSPW